MSFVNLHVHSSYSLLDGYASIKDIVAKAKRMGQNAIALTDHGNMYGVYHLFEECKRAGIKPIAGMEAYICNDVKIKDKNERNCHILLLAKNITGYKNLCRLTRLASENMYKRPRIDLEILKRHADGLICCSACIGGQIQSLILDGRIDDAYLMASEYQQIFGGDFYLEYQNSGLAEQLVVNDEMDRIAGTFGIKRVLTVDSHYVNKEDSDMHDNVLCIGLGRAKDDPNRYHYAEGQYYLKSEEEARESGFQDILVTNTQQIADKCEVYDLPMGQGIPKVAGAMEKLRELAYDGLMALPEADDSYIDRLEKELGTIEQLGYADYFLLIRDAVQWLKDNGKFLGWGRGSATGSLVSYCLGITRMNPIKHGLYFERFLNSSRAEPPDIDIDICDDDRADLLKYLHERYGSDNVAHITVFSTLGVSQVIRDVGKMLGKSTDVIEAAIKALPHDPLLEFKDVKENTVLYSSLENLLGEDMLQIIGKIAGKPRHVSMHSAGIIISRVRLSDIIPSWVKDGNMVLQYDYNALKHMNLEKCDFLGLKTLRVIRDTCKMANIKVDDIPLDDKKTYMLMKRGQTIGVFQFESYGYRKFLQEFRPSNYDDIMMVNALYRPGAMQDGSGLAEVVARRFGRKPIEYIYPHPEIEALLKGTYGVMIYQEQLMGVARVLAGLSLEQVDILRGAVAKKKVELLEAQKEIFIKGCMEQGHNKEFAEECFATIEYFGRYGWNKAHASAYSMLSYVTAYLKANYPHEFMCAMLNTYVENTDKVKALTEECNRMGIKFNHADINASAKFHRVVTLGSEKVILRGLMSVPGCGEKSVNSILSYRATGFTSVEDFRNRVPKKECNATVMKALTKAGAFANLSEKDSELAF